HARRDQHDPGPERRRRHRLREHAFRLAAYRPQLVGAGPLEEGASAEVAPRVRAFFGLPVPEAQRSALGAFLAASAHAAPRFRWTPAANLHLTVRFIGNADRGLVEGIADRLVDLGLAAFDVDLGDLGTFKR